MTPQEFINKWRDVELKERSASQSHFNDLCRLLGVPDPITSDKTGDTFCFEKGASKTSGGEGWADVWKRDCFAWEYKGKKKDLDKAFGQLLQYAIALENPPLLIVSDMDRIRIHTNWTNTVQMVHEIALDDLMDGAKRDLLRACFDNPEKLKPQKTRQVLTEEVADQFAQIAQRLRKRGHDAHAVAHFVNRLVFCMFAEDVNLLPDKMFERMIKVSRPKPETFASQASKLFAAMRTGGDVGFEQVEWFNGGLFDSDEALPLTWEDLDDLIRATVPDWSDIDPSILGTLFERGLDPEKRSQLGAHYTDREKIMQIVQPVVVQPLLSEWAAIRDDMAAIIQAAPVATKDKLLVGAELATRTRAFKRVEELRQGFLDRLRNYRVLDPACGSGNFLYIALTELKNIEHRANLEAEALGLQRPALLEVGPDNVLGIELNPYAAELARVSVWIGEIQWMRRNGFEAARDPILRTLTTIENRDALLNVDGTRAVWPKADAIIGNPPFLGSKFLRNGKPATRTRPAQAGLGDKYVNQLFQAFAGQNPGSADLVTYWFCQAQSALSGGRLKRIGFVATKSIAKGASNFVLARLVNRSKMNVTSAVSNTDWVVDGAEVRVSLVTLSTQPEGWGAFLDGRAVDRVNVDLTVGLDIASAMAMKANKHLCFQGVKQNGTFTISAEQARSMLRAPTNPNGRKNSDVVKRFFGNDDVSMRDQDGWIVDFSDFSEYSEAIQYEKPFAAILHVKDERQKRAKGETSEVGKLSEFWLMQRPRPDLRSARIGRSRVLAVPETSEHFIFRWLPVDGVYSGSLFVFPRDDEYFFGVLQSRLHTIWARRSGNNLGAGNQDRYNKTVTFETFPFPDGLTPDIPVSAYVDDPRVKKIAAAAADLCKKRENWINPPEWVDRVPEVVPGYPDRVLPKDAAAAAELKKLTLTNLYNARPAWLDHAHRALDEAVAEAYGWGDDWRAGKLTDDEILARLFRLNQERAEAEKKKG